MVLADVDMDIEMKAMVLEFKNNETVLLSL
jgi:hypothetical protein